MIYLYKLPIPVLVHIVCLQLFSFIFESTVEIMHFGHLFIFTIKYLTNADVPARLTQFFCVLHLYFKV